MRSRLGCRTASIAPLRAGLAIAVLLGAGSASAASRATADTSCAPAAGDSPAAVAGVTDDLGLKLVDGRLIRLDGIDPPRATVANPGLPAEARHRLEVWLAELPREPGSADHTILLHVLAAMPDRWNRIAALVFALHRDERPLALDTPASAEPAPAGSATASPPSGAPPIGSPEPPSAAQDLLAQGFARAKPDRLLHACFPAFLQAENAARAKNLGLWADPQHAVLGADDADGLAVQTGGMVLVQGVLRVHESRGTLYLTLGRDRWGFTAVLSRRNAERFAKAGLDLVDYAGTPVRLRGELDTRFGPRIDLTDPDQVESLEPGTEAVYPAAATLERGRDDVRTGPKGPSRWKR
jgi:endonuclease YncB( thermonuclease family)